MNRSLIKLVQTKDSFKDKTLVSFSMSTKIGYPSVFEQCLIPHLSLFILQCENGFSEMLYLKNKCRSTMEHSK